MPAGKTANVTGSTSGNGLGIARSLAGEGVNIVLNGPGDRQDYVAANLGLAGMTMTIAFDGG